MRRQQSGRSVSRFASRQRAAVLSDIIVSKNIKLSQINYLARKVDVLFSFPSRPYCTCNRTYGKTRYDPEDCSLQERTKSEANCTTRNFVTELLAKYRSNRMKKSRGMKRMGLQHKWNR